MENLPQVIGGIIVALLAAFSAIATQRSSSNSSRIEKIETSRIDMETEAYIRARDFDTETIKRQSQTIADLQVEMNELRTRLALCEKALKDPEDG